MSILGALTERYRLPYLPHSFQEEILEAHGNDDRYGYYFDPGMGKTFSAALHALHLSVTGGVKHWIVLTPPVVIRNFVRGVQAIKDTSGQPLSAMPYMGTPKQRETLRGRWKDTQFIVMSWEIFKMDFDHIDDFAMLHPVGLIADEAHRQKNIRSHNHRALYHLGASNPVLLLTGSPTTVPEDSYAYMRFTNPRAYPSFGKFLRTHVKDGDDPYGRDKTYQSLDLLQQNFLHRAARLYKKDHLKDLPAVTYTPFIYDLDPRHMQLYRNLAEQKLLELENGGLLDATTPSRLVHMLQQIIINYGHFSGDETLQAQGLHLMEEVLDEIGEEKLLVVCNYRLSNSLVTQRFAKFGATGIMGGMSHSQRNAAIDRFTQDKSCRVLVIQPQAAGEGVDGLQHVCSEMLFLECPSNPPQFYQAVSRLDRMGQSKPVNCRIAVANGTLQVRRQHQLLNNDATIATVEGGTHDLRRMIYGD